MSCITGECSEEAGSPQYKKPTGVAGVWHSIVGLASSVEHSTDNRRSLSVAYITGPFCQE